MDLYQAGYTRRGNQGEGSGWSIVSESEGMSPNAKDGFSGFAANLAELIEFIDMPDEAVGMFRDDRFLYYLHINYKTKAEEGGDKRGVSFTHGYCFGLTDYYTLCKEPEKLLGVTSDAFLKDYDSNVKAYPIIESFPYENMDLAYLKQKYQLSGESYRRLLIGATCAIEGYTDSLCIKVNCAKEEYAQICKEVMYLIMQGLPYHLRIKVTFFSYRGGKTSIYFSDKIEGTNYFDLDRQEYACDKSRLEKYRFTLIYNLPQDDMRLAMFKSIAEFMEESFHIPLKDMDCEQIEQGFKAKSKNLLSKDEWKDLAIPTLASFLSMPLKESNAVEEYLAQLLDIITDCDLVVNDGKLLNHITNRAQGSANETLRNSYLRFYARQILAISPKDAYELLWRYYQKNKEHYSIIIDAVKNMNEMFYLNYYKEVFLPRRLTDMKSVFSYLQEEDIELAEVFTCFYELLMSITKKELSKSLTFLEMFEVHKNAKKIADLLWPDYAEHYLESTDYQIWERFNLEAFNPEEIVFYGQCNLDKLLEKHRSGRVYEVIKIVNELIEVLDNSVGSKSYQKNAYALLFKNEILEDPKTQKMLLKIMKKYDLPKVEGISERNFDFVVICHYNESKNKFDILKLVKFIHEKRCEHIFQAQYFKQILRSSEILNVREFKYHFSKELKKIIEENKESRNIDKQMMQSIKKFYSYLTNEEIIEEPEPEPELEEDPMFSIHKIAVGYLALFATGFFLFSLNRYANVSLLPIVCIGIMVGVMFLLLFGWKVYKNGGFEGYFEEAGFTTIQDLLVGIGLFGILGILSLIAVLLLWKLPVLQQEPYFTRTLVIMITMDVYILIAIAAAVWNSMQEE